jgi:Ca2+-binding RTX toxin-like protein
LEPVKKIEHFLGSLKKIMSDVAEGLGIFHAISFPEIGNPLAEVGIEKFQDWLKDKGLYTGDIKGIPKGYLEKSRDNGDFKSFFNALNPRGYYFPNKPIIAQLSPKVLGKVLPAIGSADGDWIEGYKGDFLNMYGDNLYGNKGNDVLRGYQGNDELTGGQGWDFLDGGDGNDTATYNDSPKNIGIIVHTERKVYDGPNVSTYSDIYRVEDGYGQEDILVDIEEIVGSDSNDKMYGGEGIDIFEAEKGDDYFQGNGGNDKFYGDDGNDTAYGGIGDDELRGEGGDDTLYGGDGNDKISGGFR